MKKTVWIDAGVTSGDKIFENACAGMEPITLPDSGDRTQFASGAVRDCGKGKGRCDLLPPCAILRVSVRFEEGAAKYDDDNWKKGIPLKSFINSATRHIQEYMDGQDNEDHLCAAAWNLLCAMWTEEKKPELNNIIERQGKRSYNYFKGAK